MAFALHILFALLTTGCFIFAPEGYSLPFCASLMALFLLQNGVWLYDNRQQRKLRFELLFMISFFFVNLVYPVFYAPIRPSWHIFSLPFSFAIINRATALACMAYSFYMLGVTHRPWRRQPTPEAPSFSVPTTLPLLLSLLTLLSLLFFVLTGGYTMLNDVYRGGGSLRDVGLFSYFSTLLSITALLLAAFTFRTNGIARWISLTVLAIVIAVLLSSGSRHFSLSLVLILLVGYSMFCRRLKGWQLLLILLCGTLFLALITHIREYGWDTQAWRDQLASTEHVGPFDAFRDLIINSINLYVLTDWGTCHPPVFFRGMLLDLASPFPGLGTFITHHTDLPLEWLHGGDFPSYLLLGHERHWGTGTNLVGEVYYSFGALGTAAIMYLLGVLIREASYRAAHSPYWFAFYMLMVGHAVIYPRAALLYDPRIVTWSLLLLFLLLSCFRFRSAKRVS